MCPVEAKRRLHDRKTEHFKALSKNCQPSAIADYIASTGHNIKWEHFEILAAGRSDIHCRIKESLLIKDLRWLETVSSTFQDLQFDGSLEPLFIG